MESGRIEKSVGLLPRNSCVRQIALIFISVKWHAELFAGLRIGAVSAVVAGAWVVAWLRVTSGKRIVGQTGARDIQVSVGILVGRPIIDAEHTLVVCIVAERERDSFLSAQAVVARRPVLRHLVALQSS